MKSVAKKPSDCTEEELKEFERLLIEAGEVDPEGARARIENAEKLLLLSKDKIVAIGAIKNPYKSYRDRIFKKSQSAENGEEYNKEIGWFYVKPTERGKGTGEILLKTCLKEIGNENCYATTRINNDAMHHLFDKYSLEETGNEYDSERGSHKLKVYIKKS